MLAESYDKYPVTDFKADVFSQPKLDGARCIATAKGLFTRQGKEWVATPHIVEDLALFFETFPDAILDGELYDHDTDFNTIMSLVKQKNPDVDDFAASRAVIKYHVYDYPSHPGRFSMRSHGLKNDSIIFGPSIVVVETSKVLNQEALDFLNAGYLSEGYEGQMVRTGTSEYENRRTKDLKKRKEFIDAEYTIVDISEGAGNRAGMAGYITYQLGDGTDRTFGSGIKGTHAFCKELLQNAEKYQGGQGTVRYFELTLDGIPRFPVTVDVFEGKRDV